MKSVPFFLFPPLVSFGADAQKVSNQSGYIFYKKSNNIYELLRVRFFIIFLAFQTGAVKGGEKRDGQSIFFTLDHGVNRGIYTIFFSIFHAADSEILTRF